MISILEERLKNPARDPSEAESSDMVEDISQGPVKVFPLNIK